MKQNYMARLQRAAQWMLPSEEAAEVIADYEEMAAQTLRTEEELQSDLGDPVKAVRLLADKKAYRRWLICFAVMAVCAVFPAWSLCWNADLSEVLLWYLVYALGVGLSLWFWRGRRETPSKRLPAVLPILLMVFLLTAVGMMLWTWRLYELVQAPFKASPQWRAQTLGNSWFALCLLAAAAGIAALVLARMRNRRWRALYVWTMTVSLVSLQGIAMLKSLNPDLEGDWRATLLRWAVLAVIGLIGTGVSLRC